MKTKLSAAVVAFLFALSMSTTAMAHCGGCGAGADKKLEKTCKKKCEGKKDAKCVAKCKADHKKKDHKNK